jgi:preprotein translocase subunit SecE
MLTFVIIILVTAAVISLIYLVDRATKHLKDIV